MHVIKANNVNDAYVSGLRYICREGQFQSSRAGDVLVLPEPLTMVYENPTQRVLLDAGRDSNPFFSIFESLWMLSGRNDARWLDCFIHDFSSRFAEADGHQHGAYGYRWRNHFDLDGGGHPRLPDQLETVIKLLKKNPDDRRVVLQMWDPAADLGADVNDVPCNLCALPRIRREKLQDDRYVSVLDLTVFNRSNDFVFGMAGANAVHFSVLLEYLAGRIGVAVGRYIQVSGNCHIYTKQLARLPTPLPSAEYPKTRPLGILWDFWDADLQNFMQWVDAGDVDAPGAYANAWFYETAEPLFRAHAMWKRGGKQQARDYLVNTARDIAPDWRRAAIEWFERRLERMSVKQGEKQ